MKTTKILYEKPFVKVINVEIQAIICQSPQLEPIDPGDEHGWEYYEGED